MRKAIILMTVARRYHELSSNLVRVREVALRELGYQPDVVVVWAAPEVGRLWLFQKFLAEGQVTHVVGRPPLAEENGYGGATSHPESHNIRAGLEFILSTYEPQAHYVVMNGADISVNDGTLKFIDAKMKEHQAVLYHWDNGSCNSGIWHTNFFAVCLDERYWPPLSPPEHADVLERQWGRKLELIRPEGVFEWNNSRNQRFKHLHESESLEPLPFRPQHTHISLPLIVCGWKAWYARLWDSISGVLSKRKCG